MKRFQMFILLLIVNFFVIQSTAFSNNITVVCEEWSGFTNKNGTGVYWEIIKAIYEPVGVKVNTKVMPWKRADNIVLLKKADAIVGDYFYKKQSGKNYLYPKWHISVEDPIVVFFKNDKVSWKKNGIKSLAGKKVGWIRGYDYHKKKWLNVKVKKYELTNLSQGVKMLSANRIFGLIDYEKSVKQAGKKLGLNIKNLEMKTMKLGNKLFLKFSNTDRSKKLIKIFDKQMTKLVKSRKIQKIYSKWGHKAKKLGKERFGTK